MKKYIRFLLPVMALAFTLLLSGCCLSHQWTPATCNEPETCTKCGETEGEALGHAPGEWETSYDILSCEAAKQQLCSRCSVVLASETEELTSFVADGTFVFSPEQYLQKLVSLPEGWESYQDGPVEYTFRADSDNLEAIVTYMDQKVLLQFYKADDVPLSTGEAQSTGIQHIRYCDISDNGWLYELAFMACDPQLENGILIPMSILYANMNGQENFEYHGIIYDQPAVSGAEIGYSELAEVRSYDIIAMPAA